MCYSPVRRQVQPSKESSEPWWSQRRAERWWPSPLCLTARTTATCPPVCGPWGSLLPCTGCRLHAGVQDPDPWEVKPLLHEAERPRAAVIMLASWKSRHIPCPHEAPALRPTTFARSPAPCGGLRRWTVAAGRGTLLAGASPGTPGYLLLRTS